MKLLKIYKGIIHSNAKNGELQFSFFAVGDYQDYVKAKCKCQNWCSKENEEAGYQKYTFELTTLYGECQTW